MRQAQRILHITITQTHIYLRGVVYHQHTRSFTHRYSYVLRGIEPSRVSKSIRLRFLCKLAFFPFQYRVMVVLPHEMCRSSYFKVPIRRNGMRNQTVGKDELRSVFANYMGKFLERNKHHALSHTLVAEPDLLLAHNYVTDVMAGTTVYFPDTDKIFANTHHTLEVGVIHTFCPRAILEGCTSLLPRRARIHAIVEEGIHLSLSLYLTKASARPKQKSVPFGVVWVKNDVTELYTFDGEVLLFADSFPFGYRTLYDALNNSLLIGFDSFFEILQRVVDRHLSITMQRKLEKILEKEMARFVHGITAFKKRFGPRIHINAGSLEPYFTSHSKTRQTTLTHHAPYTFDSEIEEVNTPYDHAYNADIIAALRLYKINTINTLAIQSVRWLLPDVLYGKKSGAGYRADV